MFNLRELCVFPLHVWDRELDARLIFALFALNKGHPVLLGHEYNLKGLYTRFTNLFYYGAGRPIMSSRVKDWQKPVLERGGYVSLVFEEGLNDLRSCDAYRGITDESISACSSIHTWFKEEIKYILEASSASLHSKITSRTKSSVNVRFELLGHLGIEYFKEQTDAISKLFNEYYLISDNFDTALFGGVSSSSIQMNNIARLSVTTDEKNILRHKAVVSEKTQLSSAKSFADLINKVVSTYPHKQFVFRPHPVSGYHFWSRHLKDARNLTLIYKSSYEPWLFSCQAVLHAGCTVGLQSELHSLPSIDLSNLFDDLRPSGLSTSVSSYRPDTFHALDAAMRDIESRTKTMPVRSSLKKDGLFQPKFIDDNSLFAANIDSLNLNLLSTISESHRISVPLSSQLSTLLDELKAYSNISNHTNDSSELPKQIALNLGKNPPLKTKSRFYSATEIYNKINRLTKLLGLKLKIVHYPKSNCFLLLPLAIR